jgi:hypothetical protein
VAKQENKKVYTLLTTSMKVYPAYVSSHLVEANIIKPFKARPRDLTHTMVGNEKRFLPPHEEILPLGAILVVKVGLFGLFGQWSPCGKSPPMLHVRFVRRSPRFMSGLKSVFWADNFAFKVCRQCRVLRRQTCRNSVSNGLTSHNNIIGITFDAQVPAKL